MFAKSTQNIQVDLHGIFFENIRYINEVFFYNRSKSLRYFRLTLITLAVFSAALIVYILKQNSIEQAYKNRFNAYLLADELRQSSDDLTKTARAYVTTGTIRYKRHYQEILDIRNGHSHRPNDASNVYWDLVLEDDARPRPSGPAVSLLKLIHRLDITADERQMLKDAKNASDKLTQTEREAMALIESDMPLSDSKRLKAIQMLQTEAYYRAKAEIMEPVAVFHEMIRERTVRTISSAKRLIASMRVLLIFTGVLSIFWLWRLLVAADEEKRARLENEKLFRAVFENAAVGLAQLDRSGRFLNANESFCGIIGYERDEMMSPLFSFKNIVEDQSFLTDFLNDKTYPVGEPGRYPPPRRCTRKDGGTVWLNLFTVLLRDEKQTPESFVVAAVDITIEKRAGIELDQYRKHLEHLLEGRAAALKNSERRFRFIAEHTHDVIWIMDLSTERLTYVNPAVKRIQGYAPDELLDGPAMKTLTPESVDRARAMLYEVVTRWNGGDRTDTMRVFEAEQVHKDGHIVHIEVSATLHANDAGKLVSVLGVTRDITARRQAEEAVRRLAFYDPLTQLPNRRLLLDRLQQAIVRAARENARVALLFIDLDKFKPINDELGHEVGDWMLQSAASRMEKCLRAYDTAARIGGDEFVILLPDLAYIEDSMVVAERIRAAVAEPFITDDGRHLEISSSIGAAFYPDHAADARELLRVGDEAMYKAKKSGRNKVEVFSPLALSSPATIPPKENILRISWQPVFMSGNEIIDDEHRSLVRTANRLLSNAMLPSSEQADLMSTVADVLKEIKTHFQNEETVLLECKYERLEEHAEIHRAIITQAETLREKALAGDLAIKDLAEFLAFDVIMKHMTQDDRDFFEFVGAPPEADSLRVNS